MPGRLSFDADSLAVATFFGLSDVPVVFKADYNVAPYEAVSVVAATAPVSARPEKDHQAIDSSRRIFRARWGLHPHWAEHRDARPAPYNAPADKLATNGMYRKSLAERRGPVPVSGYYVRPEDGPTTRNALF